MPPSSVKIMQAKAYARSHVCLCADLFHSISNWFQVQSKSIMFTGAALVMYPMLFVCDDLFLYITFPTTVPTFIREGNNMNTCETDNFLFSLTFCSTKNVYNFYLYAYIFQL